MLQGRRSVNGELEGERLGNHGALHPALPVRL